MVIGDSIAVGVSMIRKECVRYAKSGWNSNKWNREYLNKASNTKVETVIISLGANDTKDIDTEKNLRKLRESISGKRVFWISPGKDRKPRAQAAIEKIASEYNDTILQRPTNHMSSDGVHPTMTGYKELANQTK